MSRCWERGPCFAPRGDADTVAMVALVLWKWVVTSILQMGKLRQAGGVRGMYLQVEGWSTLCPRFPPAPGSLRN